MHLLSTVFIRINGVSELVNALLIIFGGGLLPLDLYPKLLLRISEVTPFYAVMYAPISIIVHDNDLGKVLFILGVQIFLVNHIIDNFKKIITICI